MVGRPSPWLLVLLLLLVAGEAHAAACCVLAAPGRSGRLPLGEVFGVLAGYSLEARPGAWDRDGDLRFSRSDLQFTHRFTPQVLVRPHRVIQVSAALPVLLNASRFGDDTFVGGGVGDAVLLARVEPVAVGSFRKAPPLPGIGLGFSLPMGRPTWNVPSGNLAAITGTGYFAVTPAVTLDKAFQRGGVGWDLSGTFSLPRPGDPDRTAPGIGWSTSGFGAFYASSTVTVSTSVGVRGASPGWRAGKAAGRAEAESFAGLGLVLEPRALHRVTLGVQGSVPIPKLGVSRAVAMTASVGYSFSVARPGSTAGH